MVFQQIANLPLPKGACEFDPRTFRIEADRNRLPKTRNF